MIADDRVETFRALFPDGGQSEVDALVATDLGVQFGGLSALRNVTFDVHAHETMSIVGQNGAGKSTLLNAISGLVASTPASSVTVAGTVISGQPAWRRSRAGIGRAFQDPPLIDQMTCRDNLMVGARFDEGASPLTRIVAPRRAAARERRVAERADALLDLIGLSKLSDRLAGSLPYGARKMLDIARGLMCEPRLLLLDEPTSGLDKVEQAVVEELLLVIRASGRVATLMVEHHMELVRSVSDRVLVLEAGSIAMIEAPEIALAVAPSDEKDAHLDSADRAVVPASPTKEDVR